MDRERKRERERERGGGDRERKRGGRERGREGDRLTDSRGRGRDQLKEREEKNSIKKQYLERCMAVSKVTSKEKYSIFFSPNVLLPLHQVLSALLTKLAMVPHSCTSTLPFG